MNFQVPSNTNQTVIDFCEKLKSYSLLNLLLEQFPYGIRPVGGRRRLVQTSPKSRGCSSTFEARRVVPRGGREGSLSHGPAGGEIESQT